MYIYSYTLPDPYNHVSAKWVVAGNTIPYLIWDLVEMNAVPHGVLKFDDTLFKQELG